MPQFWRESGIQPEELSMPNTYRQVTVDSQRPANKAEHSSQTGLACKWTKIPGLPVLEVPIVVNKVQAQCGPGLSGQHEVLPRHQMSSASLLPIPEEAAHPSLAELWDADNITQQLLAVKLTQQALQLSPPQKHKTWQLDFGMAAWPTQQGLQLLPQVLMMPRLSSRCVIENRLSISLSIAHQPSRD